MLRKNFTYWQKQFDRGMVRMSGIPGKYRWKVRAASFRPIEERLRKGINPRHDGSMTRAEKRAHNRAEHSREMSERESPAARRRLADFKAMRAAKKAGRGSGSAGGAGGISAADAATLRSVSRHIEPYIVAGHDSKASGVIQRMVDKYGQGAVMQFG